MRPLAPTSIRGPRTKATSIRKAFRISAQPTRLCSPLNDRAIAKRIRSRSEPTKWLTVWSTPKFSTSLVSTVPTSTFPTKPISKRDNHVGTRSLETGRSLLPAEHADQINSNRNRRRPFHRWTVPSVTATNIRHRRPYGPPNFPTTKKSFHKKPIGPSASFPICFRPSNRIHVPDKTTINRQPRIVVFPAKRPATPRIRCSSRKSPAVDTRSSSKPLATRVL